MRYAETAGRIFARKSDYVNSIVRACARRLHESCSCLKISLLHTLCLAFVLKQINVVCHVDQCCELLDMFFFLFFNHFIKGNLF